MNGLGKVVIDIKIRGEKTKTFCTKAALKKNKIKRTVAKMLYHWYKEHFSPKKIARVPLFHCKINWSFITFCPLPNHEFVMA